MGKAVAREPVNIVKAIVGEKGTDEQQPGTVSNHHSPQSRKLQQLQQQDDAQSQKRLQDLRRQKQHLEKEIVERERLKAEEVEKRSLTGEELKLKERKQIVQLEKAEEKKRALQPQHIRGLQGTHEIGPRRGY